MENQEQTTHKRRVRYKGTHPRNFHEKYKELQPEKYKDTITDSIGSIGESMENLTHWTENFDPYEEKMKEMATLARQQQMAMGSPEYRSHRRSRGGKLRRSHRWGSA